MRAGLRSRQRKAAGITIAIVLALVSSSTLAGAKGRTGASGPQVILRKVSNGVADNASAGEPWVVANPKDPRKVTAIWLGTYNATEPTRKVPPSGVLPGYCGIGTSNDGGRTWSIRRAPFQNDFVPYTVPICGDPAGSVLADGTIVFTSVQLGWYEWVQSITSRDNGKNWTAPTAPFGAAQYAQSVAESGSLQDMGFGRQWLAVDPIKNAVYVQSQVDAATTGRMMTVSSDRGATWSVPRNVGSTSLGPIGAAYGKVAGVYLDGDNKIFQVSGDHGVTWRRNRMPAGGAPGAGGQDAADAAILGEVRNVAADPTKPDRFAVLAGNGSDRLEVWITPDAGKTLSNWKRTKVFTTRKGDSFDHPWIAFSPTGALGVVWRYVHANGTYDTDAVVSRNGGLSFDNPVRLTAGRGPSPAETTPTPGDDCACNLFLTKTTLVTTWGDRSSGFREIWFGGFDYTRGKPGATPRS